MAKSTAKELWSLLLPVNCVGCQQEGAWICPRCLSALRPHRSELCFCGQTAVDGLCPRCRSLTKLEGLTTLFSYAEPTVREIIQHTKYYGHTDALGFFVGQFRRRLISSLPHGDWTLVPVPLAAQRLRERGFNQSELLCQHLGDKLWPSSNLLVRTRETMPQVQLKRRNRAGNVRGCFKVKPKAEIPAQVILVDDVVTSGSTLGQATRALRKAGAERVWGLTLAHG